MKRYILGAGAHGRVVADVFLSQVQPVTGFLDDNPDLHGQIIAGIPVVGDSHFLEASELLASAGLIVAFGNAYLRLQLTRNLQTHGLTLINAIHRQSVVSPSAILGKGICICAGAVISPNAVLGNAVIVNTGATVDHDCEIGDGAHLSPGVHLAGRVKIGHTSFLGTGVSVAPRTHIGNNTIIGAGAVVLSDIPDNVLAYGIPARIVRELSDSIDWKKLL